MIDTAGMVASGGFLPAIGDSPKHTTQDQSDSDGDYGYGLFLEKEDECADPPTISTAASPLFETEPATGGAPSQGYSQQQQQTGKSRTTPPKPSIKKTSSYGDMELLGENIPISRKRTAWKTLPAPVTDASTARTRGTLKRAQSSASFFPATTTSETTSEASTIKRNVSFGSVQFRAHQVTIGDNPSCLYGTPISLDWDFQEEEPIDLDLYEINHHPQRRTLRQMHLNSYQRKHVLAAAGHSAAEIKQAKQEAARIRWQREVTRNCLPFSKLEDLVESAVRKTRRGLGSNSKSHRKRNAAATQRTDADAAVPPDSSVRTSVSSDCLATSTHTI